MKKYSEEFINNIDVLKTAICGFEFEFYLKELSFYSTLEKLNKILDPIQVYGFRQYHPDFKPDSHRMCLTPDLSGGSNLVELITGPMPYFESKIYLIKILKFIQDFGYTNDKASIHFNISFPNKNLNDLNILKMILDIDEEEIYSVYPIRKNNVYAKSVKRIIPYKNYNFNDISIDVVKNNLRLPNDKYYGINFLYVNKEKNEQRLEFRYIGGSGYEKNIGDIIYFLDKFIILTDKCIDGKFTDNEINQLEKHLDKNISAFKTFSNYDNFLIQFPNITLQVDKVPNYDLVSAYYLSIYPRLFTLIESTDNLKDCIINWITEQQRLEVVDSIVKCIMNIDNFDFINCQFCGIAEDCSIVNSVITNSQLIRCNLNGDDIKNSKVMNCVSENSDIENSFIQAGFINCNVVDGIIRGGGIKLGAYANISSTTKVVTDKDNFFDTTFGEDEKKKKDINSQNEL